MSSEVKTDGRCLTPSENRTFAPQHLAHTHDEEIGYRRGFDQGVAALADLLGVDSGKLQATAWKKRVQDFRFGRLKDAPWETTEAERRELRRLIPASLGRGPR